MDATLSRDPDGDDPVPGDAAPDADAEPHELAGYQLGAEVARGAMGRVVRAVDRRLGRVVAVKQLIDDHPRRRARFVREAEITARLQHPSIVPIYEAGTLPDGTLGYAMKLVAGRPLDQVLRDTPTLAGRLALLPRVIDVVEAIAYAHGERVVHRDLKPSNIVLGEFGETIVIDWGVAKRLDASDDADAGEPEPPTRAPTDPVLTAPGAVVGTPAYMAPEQAAGRAAEVDDRADVYALGALLHHLLAGRVPPRPPPPLAASQGVPAALAAIVARALAPAPTDRYTARELAAELRRFTTGQLVAAHRYTRREVLARWLRRHRAAVAVGAAAVVALAVVAGLAAWRVVGARDRAEAARAQAVARVDALILERAHNEPAGSAALAQLRELSPGSPAWAAARVVASDAAVRGVPRPIGRHAGAGAGPVVALAFAGPGAIVSASRDHVERRDLAGGLLGVHPVGELLALSADGSTALSRHRDRLLQISTATGTATALGPSPAPPRAHALSRDGRTVAIADATTTTLYAAGAAPRVLGASSPLLRLAPDASYLVGALDGVLGRWLLPAGTWEPLPGGATLDPGLVEISPDGRRVAARLGGAVFVVDVATGRRAVRQLTPIAPELGLAPATATAIAFAPDGARWIAADATHAVSLEGEPAQTQLHAGGAPITGLAYLADGSGAAFATGEGFVRWWRPGWNFVRGVALGSPIAALAGSPDGRVLVAATATGELHGIALVAERQTVWPTPLAAVALASDGSGIGATPAGPVAIAPDGSTAALAGCTGAVTVVAAALDRRAARCADQLVIWDGGAPRASPARDAALLAFAGPRLLAATATGAVFAAAEPDAIVQLGQAPRALVASRDGRRAAIALADRVAAIDLATGAVHDLPIAGAVALALSSDGRWLAAGDRTGAVTVIDPRGMWRVLQAPTAAISVLAFSADDLALIAGSHAPALVAWDLASGTRRSLLGHRRPPRAVAASATEIWSADEHAGRRAADDLPRGEPALRRWIGDTLH